MQTRLAELIKFLKTQYTVDLDDVYIVFNARLTSTAGRAFPLTGRIELSTKLYEANKEAFHLNTIPHELAHIVACRALGSKGHDAAWKSVMHTLGLEGTRCHRYEVKRAKTYQYQCACQTHDFTPQRHAWALKGKSYVCKQCKGVLSYVY